MTPSAISRATRIPEGVLKDGMDADRAFNWIAENSKDEFHRQLANTLLDLTEGVKISPTTGTAISHVIMRRNCGAPMAPSFTRAAKPASSSTPAPMATG
jgi:hypothetical protein